MSDPPSDETSCDDLKSPDTSPQGQTRENEGEKSKKENTAKTILTSDIAKWLIPSATVVFVIVGYIVQTSQEDLLGVGPISHSSTSYIEAAALFIRDLISLPLDVLFENSRALVAHWATLSVTILAMGILAATRCIA